MYRVIHVDEITVTPVKHSNMLRKPCMLTMMKMMIMMACCKHSSLQVLNPTCV